MNRRRRRVGRARRKKARLIREMREWSKSGYTTLPKRGRLKEPAARLAFAFDHAFRVGFERLETLMAPVLAFAGVPRTSTANPTETKE